MAEPYVRPGSYTTKLMPQEEMAFRLWLSSPFDADGKRLTGTVPFDPANKNPDYDMRGFFRGLLSGDKKAVAAINPSDKQLHYPDYWKTPIHPTFSNESKYAYTAAGAPAWTGDDASGWMLKDSGGGIVKDERTTHQKLASMARGR